MTDDAVQIEFHGEPPFLIAKLGEGLYWLSTHWFNRRHERLIAREDLEDCWPPEVLELADAE